MNSDFEFKNKYSFDNRKLESNRILTKYEDKIPIIVETVGSLTIDKNKFLVPKDMSLAQFNYVLRKRIKLNDAEGFFLFINDKMACNTTIISLIYKENKDEDGFLYIKCSKENTFG